jgi:hypothetical protein
MHQKHPPAKIAVWSAALGAGAVADAAAGFAAVALAAVVFVAVAEIADPNEAPRVTAAIVITSFLNRMNFLPGLTGSGHRAARGAPLLGLDAAAQPRAPMTSLIPYAAKRRV